jgi:Uma2 family endonuclease
LLRFVKSILLMDDPWFSLWVGLALMPGAPSSRKVLPLMRQRLYTPVMSAKTLMTMAEFLELPDEELRRHELWQGEPIELGETIFAHNWIRDKLLTLISFFLMHSELGGEALVETGIQFDSSTLARPDLAYWDADHLSAIDWLHGPVEVVPQLLAEVVSPSNSLRELFEDAKYYLRAVVKVAWIVERDPFTIHVFEDGHAMRVLRPGDKLEAPSVLPGFSENVSRFVPPVRYCRGE